MSDPTFATKRSSAPWMLAVAAIGILALAVAVLALGQALWLRWVAMMALAWWLPGTLLVAHWRLPRLDLPTAGVLAVALGLCWMVLVALVIHWLPGPIGLWSLVGAYAFGALLLVVGLVKWQPVEMEPVSKGTWAWLAVLILIGCLLRLPGLGYNEMHVDEVEVLQPARSAIEGQDNILALHTKGPGEIVVAMVVYRGLGTVNEATARLPFGLMAVVGVLAVALMGRRLFSPWAGFWAGLLLALNGFVLALSRLVQYQAAMVLLSVLAVYCAWEFAQRGERRWLGLAVVFSTFGTVAHYEFLFVTPVLLVLAWVGWRSAADRRSVLVVAATSGLLGAVLVAASYVPILLGPRWDYTSSLLRTRMGTPGAFNVPFLVEYGTSYNSVYYLFGLILLVAAGLFVGWRRARRQTLMLALWFLPAFILHLFIMDFPGTHFYLFMPSWVLLAALLLTAVSESNRLRPALRWATSAGIVLWLAISAGYLYLAFFRQSPEYVINYDQERVPFYWTPYGREPTRDPRFGFPIQEGWKAVGTLAGWGCLEGTFGSNERAKFHSGWYLTSLVRRGVDEQPDYILIARHVQALNPRYHEDALEGYQRVGEVRLRGEPRLEIWVREPLPVPYVSYDVEDFQVFDLLVPSLEKEPDPPSEVSGVALGDAMVLEAAGPVDRRLSPGKMLLVEVVWRPLRTLEGDYKVFLHVADGAGRPVAQWDGYPCLNLKRTSDWPVGEPVRDHVLLRIPEDMAPGQYRLLVGLYDEATGERLGGRAVDIGTITVR